LDPMGEDQQGTYKKGDADKVNSKSQTTNWKVKVATSDKMILQIVNDFVKETGRKVDNLVIFTHGTGDPNNPGFMVGANGDVLVGPDHFDSAKGASSSFSNIMKSVAKNMADGGNLIFGACGVGGGTMPYKVDGFLSSNGSNNSLNTFYNLDNSTITSSPYGGGKYQWNIPFDKPLTRNSVNGWVQGGYMNGIPLPPAGVTNLILKSTGGIE